MDDFREANGLGDASNQGEVVDGGVEEEEEVGDVGEEAAAVGEDGGVEEEEEVGDDDVAVGLG